MLCSRVLPSFISSSLLLLCCAVLTIVCCTYLNQLTACIALLHAMCISSRESWLVLVLPSHALSLTDPSPHYLPHRALRRKIGGTARDYWKDWVEEEQVKNIKTYYKPEEAGGWSSNAA